MADNTWYNTAAFNLGKGVGNLISWTDRTVSSFEGISSKAQKRLKCKIKEIKERHDLNSGGLRKAYHPGEHISPILKDMKAIADISGLTDTFKAMKDKALECSEDPRVSSLIVKIENLSPHEQEALADNILVRLQNDSVFSFQQTPSPDKKITARDYDYMREHFMSNMIDSFKECGLLDEDIEQLHDLTERISEPLNELIRFYLDPQTFTQKLKRIWKLQRIGFKTITMLSKTKKLADSADRFASAPEVVEIK